MRRIEKTGDQRQADHAGHGETQQTEKRFAAAVGVHPCRKRNAQQRTLQLRNGNEKTDFQFAEPHDLLEAIRGRPEKSHCCKSNEKP